MSSNEQQSNIAIIILAAGQSSRLGKPKQLLSYNGQTLIEQSLQAACGSGSNQVFLVLGAYAEEIKTTIKQSNYVFDFLINEEWQEGMASSIRAGIRHLDPSIDAAILMVCDQPFITSELLNKLIQTHRETGKKIVSCSYAGSFGPPALFHKTLFPELLQLEGDTGAKSILHRHANDVITIPFSKGGFDIDTALDYQKLIDPVT